MSAWLGRHVNHVYVPGAVPLHKLPPVDISQVATIINDTSSKTLLAGSLSYSPSPKEQYATNGDDSTVIRHLTDTPLRYPDDNDHWDVARGTTGRLQSGKKYWDSIAGDISVDDLLAQEIAEMNRNKRHHHATNKRSVNH
jgi:hypothetical protein